MNSKMKTKIGNRILLNKKKIIIVQVLLCLIFLSFSGVLTSFQEHVILPPAANYVEESQEKALQGFLIISAVKGLVAIVEGSELAGVELGDVVQPLYDAIDITWKLIAASLATLYAFGFVLKLCSILGSHFLGITFVMLAILQFTKNGILTKYTYFFGVLSFSFFIAVPMSLFLSGKLSDGLFSEDREKFKSEMESIQEDLEMQFARLETAKVFDCEWSSHEIGPVSIPFLNLNSFTFGKFEIIEDILVSIPGLLEELPELLLTTGVAWILDVIVIPLGLLLLLYKLALLFLNSFLGAESADEFEKAVSTILDKHLKKDSKLISNPNQE